jgi:small-conductance mechanosensitive channel
MENSQLNLLDEITILLLEFGDNFVGALLILLIGYIVVRVITKMLRRLLDKVGIDRLADRYINNIDFFSSNNLRIQPSILLSKLLYYFLLFLVFAAATDVLGMEVVSNLMRDAINYLPLLFTAFVLLLIGVFLADFVKNIALAAFTSLNIPAGRFLANFIFYFVLLNIFILALEQARINTNFINTNLSILLGGIVLSFAIGYGLASRSIMSNYLASFYNKTKFQIGDQVRIGSYEGKVIELEGTTLILLNEKDGSEVLIPLSHLNTEIVEVLQRRPNAPSAPPI